MRYVKPRPAWLILTAYIAGGMVIGLAKPAWMALASQWFGRAGLANAALVNVAMPLYIACLAWLYPSRRVAAAGAALAACTFVLCMGLMIPASVTRFLPSVLGQLGPIGTIACVCYLMIAWSAASAARIWRRVGLPPNPQACKKCGYLLTGNVSGVCPECGTHTGAA